MPAPRLRFKQFEGSGEWEEKPLSHYLHEHKLKSDGESKVYSVSVHKGVINQVEHLGRSFAASDTSKYNLARPFDIIYTKSPTGDFPYGIVKQNLSGSKVIVSPLYGVFEPKNQHVGYLIHAYFEEAARANNYLSPLIQKGAKNTIQISNERFASGYFYLPSNEAEQKRVAEFLVSLDAVIDAHTHKLDALRQHKRALMQQLFPQGGEKVPRLRFEQFEGSGEWGEKALEGIAAFINQKTAVNQLEANKYISTENILPDFGGIEITDKKPENGNATKFKAGDLLLSNIRPYLKKVWAAEWDGGASNDVIVVRALNALNPIYLAHTLKNDDFINYTMRGAKGLKMPRGDIEAIRQYPVPLPPTLPEQTRIAACLSSLDDLISAQADKVAGLREFKRGLMQGLFPSTTNHEATE